MMPPMVARVWRGWAVASNADAHQRRHESDVTAQLRQAAGFRGAQLLRRRPPA